MRRIFTDMMGNEVELNYPPKRIVSLVPSQTELLFDLGLNEEVVGITKFCVHPNEWFRNKKRIGGTKTVHLDIVASLQPDLIIANKEENTKEQVEALSARYPTWVSDIKTVDDGLQMIRAVGEFTGTGPKAEMLFQNITKGFAELRAAQSTGNKKRVAYFIWRNPWMCAGGDTFISDIIATMGWENALADHLRYPEIQLGDLVDKQIDIVFLSSEPYPFKNVHIAEIKAILPAAKIMLVDGEMFSWYGSRMLHAVSYLQKFVPQL